MRLASLGINKELRTVVVLGAGASRGSSCARRTGVAPPLDTDFFAQAQRLPPYQLTRKDRELFSFVREEFGDPPTLEVFFTQVAAVDRFHRAFNTGGRPSGKFGRQLVALRRLIPRVFNEALGGRDCRYHQRIGSALRTGDAVMSFNYDTLMDRALQNAGGKRWNPEVGYGFPISKGADLWRPSPRPGPAVRYPVQLLKPHGSLNWLIDSETSEVQLVNEYDSSSSQSIVPPTWDKSDVSNWPWNDVWRSARNVLRAARLMVVIGYSVPVTDQMSQALLRADVPKLSALVVVNPDSGSRRRIIEVMSSALDRSSIVVELSTLEEFGSYLPVSPAEAPIPDLSADFSTLRRDFRSLSKRLRDLQKEQTNLEREHDATRDSVEDLEYQIGDIADRALSDDLKRLQSEVQDLDARIDSLLR